MGYLKTEKPEDAKPRARQNVIMEMGMLLASLTRKRYAILTKGFVQMPSNMSGVITIPFNDHVREAAEARAASSRGRVSIGRQSNWDRAGLGKRERVICSPGQARPGSVKRFICEHSCLLTDRDAGRQGRSC